MARERKCHAIKPIAKTETPSSMLFFDCETWPFAVPGRKGVIGHKLRLGCATYLRHDGREITRRDRLRFKTADQFWEFVGSKLSPKRSLHVYAHNLLFDFRLVGGFDVLEIHHNEKWKLVLAKPPVIMAGRVNGCPVRFIDTLNYYRFPLEVIGRELGCEKGQMPPFTAPDCDWFEYCEQDVKVLETAVLHLVTMIREHDLGVMGDTIGQCAYSAYRRRFMKRPIYVHDNEEALALERQSYYGGRVDCFRRGEIKGNVYQLDANSLYPYCMRRWLYPTKLIKTFGPSSPSWLERQIAIYGAVATVRLDTSHDSYPKRIDGDPFYPVGQFRTTLCGPELETALARGEVMSVEASALYECDDIFSEYVDYFYPLKKEYSNGRDHGKREVVKLYLNSLYGKFAQRSPSYAARPEWCPPHLWGPFHIVNAIKQTRCRAMAIAGHTLEEVDGGEAYHSFPAISAYVTAAGRVVMEDYRRRIGEGNYYYSDTDSWIVSATGLDNLLLAGFVSKTDLGSLKCEWESDRCTIHSIKDYVIGDKRVIAGVRRDATAVSDDHYRQWRSETMWEAWRRGSSRECVFFEETRVMSREMKKRIALPDGTTAPIRLCEDSILPDEQPESSQS